jgi:hypothetical protein
VTQIIFSAVGVRVVDAAFTSLALIGVLVCLYTGLDAQRDLRARARANIDGGLKTTGRVARRSALASMLLHLGFFLIGLTSILGPLPATDRWQRSIVVGGAFVVVQSVIVWSQIRNQLDRAQLRS